MPGLVSFAQGGYFDVSNSLQVSSNDGLLPCPNWTHLRPCALKTKPRGGIGNGTGEGLLFLPIGSDQAGSCIASKVDAKNSCAAVGLWVPDPSRKRETLSGYPSQFKLLTSFYWFQSKSETSEIFRAGIHSTDMESAANAP